MPFPPVPVYPKGIDDDRTLFLVHNTTETKLSVENEAWASEIDIIPVEGNDIWADNGFANIDGELLYYDSVDKNDNGKVIKLKGCARQLTGNTKYHPKGTWIRSFVVAEHHNQLVDSVLKTQDFIGANFDERQKTLDWRIRNLEALQVIFDDYECPDIDFTFNVISDSPETGILTEYLIQITPPGTITSFRLDFGDGNFTTTELEGQHRYAVNSTIDPVVTVANDKCQIVQTPIERAEPGEPPVIIADELEIPFPETPDVPDFTFVPCTVPEPDVNLPPLVFPCVSLTQTTDLDIDGPGINLVSNVTFTGLENDINITQSVIRFENVPNIPSFIFGDIPEIPATIVIDPPIPPTIVIVPPQSNIVLDLDVSELPRLEVDWGAPPEMEVALTMARQVRTPQRFAIDPDLKSEFGDEFADLFESAGTMKVEYEPVGLPEEIKLIPPDIPPITVDTSNLEEIVLKAPEEIKLNFDNMPKIQFDTESAPDKIDLVYSGGKIPVEVEVATTLKIESNLPEYLELVAPNLPRELFLNADGVPREINLIAPESIPVSIPEDVYLPVKFPDVMPELEMVYKGAPIELKITMDEMMQSDEEGNNCVMIVPCKR